MLATRRKLGDIAASKAAAKGKGRAAVAMEQDVMVDPHQSLWRLLRDAVWKVFSTAESRVLHSHVSSSAIATGMYVPFLRFLRQKPCKPMPPQLLNTLQLQSGGSACLRCRHQVLAPDAVLAVVLLAAWLLREAFGPVDIVRWALAGRLPYLELPHVNAAALAAAPSGFPLQLLQPQGFHARLFQVLIALPCSTFGMALPVPTWPEACDQQPGSVCSCSAGLPNAHEIEMAAAATAAQLGLHLPPLNVPAHLQRAASVLGLPEVGKSRFSEHDSIFSVWPDAIMPSVSRCLCLLWTTESHRVVLSGVSNCRCRTPLHMCVAGGLGGRSRGVEPAAGGRRQLPPLGGAQRRTLCPRPRPAGKNATQRRTPDRGD